MGMIINKLPSQIRKVALERQMESGNTPNGELNLNHSKGQGNFNWGATREGSAIWNDVYRGDFRSFYSRYPQEATATTVTDKVKSKIINDSAMVLKLRRFWFCKNINEAKLLLEVAAKQGYTWKSGATFLNNLHWQGYPEGQVYDVHSGFRSTVDKFTTKKAKDNTLYYVSSYKEQLGKLHTDFVGLSATVPVTPIAPKANKLITMIENAGLSHILSIPKKINKKKAKRMKYIPNLKS